MHKEIRLQSIRFLGISWRVAISSQGLPSSSHCFLLCVSLLPLLLSYKHIPHRTLGPPNPGWSHLTILSLHLQRLFPNKVPFIGSERIHLSEGHHSTHYIVLECNVRVNHFRVRAIPMTRPKEWPGVRIAKREEKMETFSQRTLKSAHWVGKLMGSGTKRTRNQESIFQRNEDECFGGWSVIVLGVKTLCWNHLRSFKNIQPWIALTSGPGWAQASVCFLIPWWSNV